MNVFVSKLKWEVGKALAHLADGLLEAWAAGKYFGPNIQALATELHLVKDVVGTAAGKQIRGPAMEELLGRLRDSAHIAEDLLDELDYFRIQDQVHAKGSLALDARHTSRHVDKLPCLHTCWPAAETVEVQEDAGPRAQTQRLRGNSSASAATSNANHDDDEPSGCLWNLGKLLPCSSPALVHNHDGTPMFGLDRVSVSRRMKHIVEQLQIVRTEVTAILQSCDSITSADIAQSPPITTGRIIDPGLHGRDQVMNAIVRDMTSGEYWSQSLPVLPIVGPGGIGKTTLVHHIYHNQQVQTHFQVTVWICVSFSLNPKLLEEIKESIPQVKGEKKGTTRELIEQRLKYKRFLLVLDDIWQTNSDDWKKLLSTLNQSEEKGSMILVTTRFPSIARMVGTTHSIELLGIEPDIFRELFLAFVFGDDQYQYERDHDLMLEIGDKIVEKLRGYPLAAKTVGRLLRMDLSLGHWRSVLHSKEWEWQTGFSDIMPALKLSYDFLPFHLQQCFSYSTLFPENFQFSGSQLINLWIGLDILQPGAQNQTFEDIGLSNLNDLVTRGFFKEEETNGGPRYVMHDLLHDLALQVASDDCISLHHPNVGSIVIAPSVCHLSIIIDDDDDDDDDTSHEKFKSQLTELKTRLRVERLHTLMLFGEMDESFVTILGDLFREATALRVLYLPDMTYPVESMLHSFSALIHLRYLFLGTKDRGLMHRFLCLGTEYDSRMHLPPATSRFYNLRILDLGSWYGCCDLVWDMSNLTKLYRFYIQKDELHLVICNVGQHKFFEELKVFRVNKENEGFKPKQLEHLTELTELGIYNLENINTKEEAAEAKLIEKKYLEKLTLDWDSKQSNTEPSMQAVVLESLEPHTYLRELCIRGHGGPSCPTWLGDELVVKTLESLCLIGVSWEVLPSVGKMLYLRKLVLKHIATVKDFVMEQSFCGLIWFELVGLENFEKWVPAQDTHHMFPLLQVLIIRDCPKLLELPFSNHIVYPPEQDRNIDWFPKLQELEIDKCPELLPLPPIPWTETLCSVSIRGVMLLEKLVYSNSSHGVRLDIVGKDDLHSLDHVLAFNNLTELEELSLLKCPPVELKHLVMLTSLKTLIAESSDALVEPLGGQGEEWQLPVEHIDVQEICGNSGKEFTELFTHLPRLSKLEIMECGKITHLAVGVDLQQTALAASEVEKGDIPAAAEQEKEKEEDGLLLFPAHLSHTLRELVISHCPELVLVLLDGGGGGLQALRCLQRLKLKKTPKFLSAYLFSSPTLPFFPSSLQFLELNGLEGMATVEPLSNLTLLTQLELRNCGEDLRCKGLGPLLTIGNLSALIVYGSPRFWQVLQDEGGEQQLHLRSSKLQKLWTDDAMGLLAAPICRLLSSSLTQLQLSGTKEMERFSNKQEDALHLLASLQELELFGFDKLEHLPAGLHKLTNLKGLQVGRCPSVRSLPKDGLPSSLQKLDVWNCGNEKLIQQCRGLVGTIPEIRL